MSKIQFDRVHRVGKASGSPGPAAEKHRIIVAKFKTAEGRSIVLQHIKKLDRGKKFGVNEQLPRELAERKRRLLPQYKEAKDQKKQAKWNVDKLVVDGKTRQVQRDTVKDINIDNMDKAVKMQAAFRHSPLENIHGNSFQAHKLKIDTQDDVVPALHALYSDTKTARATHNPYAYRLRTSSGFIEHYDDDGEWGTGNKLLNLLRENNCHNVLMCVSQWYGGSHLGRSRFDHIIRTAKKCM